MSIASLWSCKNEQKKEVEENAEQAEAVIMEENSGEVKHPADFEVTPIEHASAVFTWDGKVFYIDPVGGAEMYKGQPQPDVVLVTDIHGDHLNNETLNAVITDSTSILAPQAVLDKMEGKAKSLTKVIANGETINWEGFMIEAIPMYNLREEAKQFHTKGRGNGYVISKDSYKVYFSGDTEDIPGMRELKDINKAFVCMNLPYTMTVDKAAEAVLDFAPDQVYPYHFRGQDGMSDVDKFKKLVNAGNPDIEVVMLNWYPNAKK